MAHERAARPAVRAFQAGDLEQVLALSLRAWAPVFASLEGVLGASGVFAALCPDWRQAQRQAVAATCLAPDRQVRVAELGGAVAGFAEARLDRQAGIGEIEMLAVNPPRQRRGAASALMAEPFDWIAGAGLSVAMAGTGGRRGERPGPARLRAGRLHPAPGRPALPEALTHGSRGAGHRRGAGARPPIPAVA